MIIKIMANNGLAKPKDGALYNIFSLVSIINNTFTVFSIINSVSYSTPKLRC